METHVTRQIQENIEEEPLVLVVSQINDTIDSKSKFIPNFSISEEEDRNDTANNSQLEARSDHGKNSTLDNETNSESSVLPISPSTSFPSEEEFQSQHDPENRINNGFKAFNTTLNNTAKEVMANNTKTSAIQLVSQVRMENCGSSTMDNEDNGRKVSSAHSETIIPSRTQIGQPAVIQVSSTQISQQSQLLTMFSQIEHLTLTLANCAEKMTTLLSTLTIDRQANIANDNVEMGHEQSEFVQDPKPQRSISVLVNDESERNREATGRDWQIFPKTSPTRPTERKLCEQRTIENGRELNQPSTSQIIKSEPDQRIFASRSSSMILNLQEIDILDQCRASFEKKSHQQMKIEDEKELNQLSISKVVEPDCEPDQRIFSTRSSTVIPNLSEINSLDQKIKIENGRELNQCAKPNRPNASQALESEPDQPISSTNSSTVIPNPQQILIPNQYRVRENVLYIEPIKEKFLRRKFSEHPSKMIVFDQTTPGFHFQLKDVVFLEREALIIRYFFNGLSPDFRYQRVATLISFLIVLFSLWFLVSVGLVIALFDTMDKLFTELSTIRLFLVIAYQIFHTAALFVLVWIASRLLTLLANCFPWSDRSDGYLSIKNRSIKFTLEPFRQFISRIFCIRLAIVFFFLYFLTNLYLIIYLAIALKLAIRLDEDTLDESQFVFWSFSIFITLPVTSILVAFLAFRAAN